MKLLVIDGSLLIGFNFFSFIFFRVVDIEKKIKNIILEN